MSVREVCDTFGCVRTSPGVAYYDCSPPRQLFFQLPYGALGEKCWDRTQGTSMPDTCLASSCTPVGLLKGTLSKWKLFILSSTSLLDITKYGNYRDMT